MNEAVEVLSDGNVHRLSQEVDPLLCQWARFRDLFAQGMGDGFWTVEDLEQKIAAKRAFFFPGRNAALVSAIETYPGGERVMQVLWAAGDVDEALTLLPGVEATARMMGCTGMVVEGRKAWERLLKPHGYAFFSTTLSKAL